MTRSDTSMRPWDGQAAGGDAPSCFSISISEYSITLSVEFIAISNVEYWRSIQNIASEYCRAKLSAKPASDGLKPFRDESMAAVKSANAEPMMPNRQVIQR